MYYTLKDIKSGSLFLIRQTKITVREIARKHIGSNDYTIRKATLAEVGRAVHFQNNVAPMRKK